MRKLEVKFGDLTIEGHFERPAFSLLSGAAQRYTEILHTILARHGSSVSDITYGTGNSLGDRHVLLNMPRLSAAVKVTLEKVEIGFNDLMKVALPEVTTIVTGALDVFAATDAPAKVGVVTANMNVHGVVDGSTAAAIIAPYFATVPQGLGEFSGSAVGFYYGPSGPRGYLQVIMDRSLLVPDGLYMRLSTALNARELSSQQMLKEGRETFKKVFAATGLKPDPLDLGSEA